MEPCNINEQHTYVCFRWVLQRMVHYFIVAYFRNPKLQGVVWFGLISEIFSYFFAYHDKISLHRFLF